MKATPVERLAITAQVRDALRAAARDSRRSERGGILIGHREEGAIRIEDAIRVGDNTADHSRYLRRSALAENALQAYLATSSDGYLGYVGEWHTHPLPVPPSPTDRNAMRLMSMRNRLPVALIVSALGADEQGVRFFALASDPQPIAARVLGRHHEVAINCD